MTHKSYKYIKYLILVLPIGKTIKQRVAVAVARDPNTFAACCRTCQVYDVHFTFIFIISTHRIQLRLRFYYIYSLNKANNAISIDLL